MGPLHEQLKKERQQVFPDEGIAVTHGERMTITPLVNQGVVLEKMKIALAILKEDFGIVGDEDDPFDQLRETGIAYLKHHLQIEQLS